MIAEPSTEQQRREKILAAARRSFEREGLARASMRSIAREAGCTTGAIYPLFAGKEDIYAGLLEESLDALHSHVARAVAARAGALDALLAATCAWHEYYRAHPFEAELGLYLHGNGSIRGLGEARDRHLNAQLMRTLDIFSACLARLAGEGLCREAGEDWARRERDALFATLIGITVLSMSGRTRSIGTDGEAILETTLDTLRERFSPGGKD